MPRFLSQVHSPGELEAMSQPSTVKGTENFVQKVYDTKLFTSGTTTQLTFFGAADQNRGFFTNMQQAGQLPKGQWLMAYVLAVEVLGFPVGVAGNPNIQDLYYLLKGDTPANGFPGLWYTINTRRYPQSGLIPLWDAYSDTDLRAISDNATTEATFGGSERMGWDLGTLPTGDGLTILNGQTPFAVQLEWPNAPALTFGNVYIRVSFEGTLYRPVGG